ncbi:hypothetical protein A6V39_00865 [Candidatus Mycoplasma haematobovis]|uniref:Uncharacterized protein n=1 Tax=Candidatus Mycoplasma haematobovis TaxID=432608 RepID=A0A1A9QDQ8_9MOLU|nr:hypothetical protein [Candidatus Mycoplasma haematobovis]OAL10603.1 hypothetical protein A6V39_00865 [Candidatus Mycoplasma haematobovis]
MNSVAKAGIALGVLGGASGLGYVAIQQFTTTNDIASKLAKENYQLLNNSSSDWTQILASYKEVIKTKTELKFGDFDGTTPTTDTEKELQRLCNEATKLDLSKDTNNTTYNKAKKWCTKPKPLTSVLKDKGYRMLKTDAQGDHESDLWDTKLESYNTSTANASKKFSGLDLLTQNVLKKDEATRNKLRERCRNLENKKHYEKEFEDKLDQAILWCSTDN